MEQDMENQVGTGIICWLLGIWDLRELGASFGRFLQQGFLCIEVYIGGSDPTKRLSTTGLSWIKGLGV